MLTIRYYLPGEPNALEIRGRSDPCAGRVNRRVLLTTLVVVAAAVVAVVIARAVALLRPAAVALVGFIPADHAADIGPENGAAATTAGRILP